MSPVHMSPFPWDIDRQRPEGMSSLLVPWCQVHFLAQSRFSVSVCWAEQIPSFWSHTTTLGKYSVSKSQIHKNQFIPVLKFPFLFLLCWKKKVLLYRLFIISNNFRSLQTLDAKCAKACYKLGMVVKQHLFWLTFLSKLHKNNHWVPFQSSNNNPVLWTNFKISQTSGHLSIPFVIHPSTHPFIHQLYQLSLNSMTRMALRH